MESARGAVTDLGLVEVESCCGDVTDPVRSV